MATINAASCSYADVSSAISSAAIGDTVIVPAGSSTWASQLYLTKDIYLVGAGIGSTNITSSFTATYPSDPWNPANFLIRYQSATASSNNPSRISGMTIECELKCSGIILYNPTIYGMNKIRVDHVDVKNPYPRNWMIVRGNCWGVCDNCSNSAGASMVHVYGAGAGGTLTWNYHGFSYGDANQFYFEDCTLTGTTSTAVSFFAGEGCGRYCVRHSTFALARNHYPVCDAHGNYTATGYTMMGEEFYNNTITGGTFGGTFFDLRGGKGIVHSNNFVTSGSITMKARDEYSSSQNPPELNPVDGSPQYPNEVYFFNNRKNTSGLINQYYIDATVDGHPVEDVDVFFEPDLANSYTFDGSTGVGVGLLAARPSSGLTVGVGYWATDVLNDDGTYGKLYRATGSSTWETYYTPYEYPHPLRAEVTTGWVNTFDAVMSVSASEVARLYVEYPHKRVVAGTNAVYNVHVEAYNNFTANITLDATGLPTNATDAYGTNPIAYNGATTATISTTGVSAGTYSINITGTAAGGEVGSVRVILEVVAADDCAPKVPIRKIRVKQGDNAVFTVQANPTAGYTGDMDLSASGVPTGASGSFADSSIAYNESTTYTIDSGTAAVGEHEIVITGEGPV